MARPVRAFCLAVMALLLAGHPAQAEWGGFYTPAAAAPMQARGPSDPSGICVQHILRAQIRHAIPGNLLLAIGLQEAGMMHQGELTVWPWVANAEGDGRFFDSPQTAASWVRARQADGIGSVDVGCMQINLRWHPEAFQSVEQGLDPRSNVDYAARLLVRLYAQTGDWTEAAGRYHSATGEHKAVYLGRLRQNVKIANDRLDIFRTLAARGLGGAQLVASAPAAPRVPLPSGHFWTSDITRRSGAADEGGRSLYGRDVLQPVLPTFKKMF